MMANSRIFVSRSHGDVDNNSSYIFLKGKEPGHTLSSNDIYNFDTETALVDLSNCELIIFVGCYTGAHSSKSLYHAAKAAGAKEVICFKDSILEKRANDWIGDFFEYYSQGCTVQDAIDIMYGGDDENSLVHDIMLKYVLF